MKLKQLFRQSNSKSKQAGEILEMEMDFNSYNNNNNDNSEQQEGEDMAFPSRSSSSASSSRLDRLVGALEDSLMDPSFQEVHHSFLDEYCHHFDLPTPPPCGDGEEVRNPNVVNLQDQENKLIYTDIFRDYVDVVERKLEELLRERVEDFQMNEFMQLLEGKEEQIGSDILETLLSFTDFQTFKEIMVAQRQENEGVSLDLGIVVNRLEPSAAAMVGKTGNGSA
eukprot:Nk52_evm1s163 gene=Nk52_evmTU1s163